MIVQCNHCEAVTFGISDDYAGKIQEISKITKLIPIPITPVSSYPPKWYCRECLDLIKKGE